MTDPTLSTMDLNRVVDLKSHSSKRGSRLGKWKLCLNEVDRPVLLDQAQKLRSYQQDKKGDAPTRKGRQAGCDHVVDGDYELAPLTHNEVTSRRCTSDGSDESPLTSDSNVQKGKDYVIYNNENWASIDTVTINDKRDFLMTNEGIHSCLDQSTHLNNKVSVCKDLHEIESRGGEGPLSDPENLILQISRDPHYGRNKDLAQHDEDSRLVGQMPLNSTISICAEVCAESEALHSDEGSNDGLEECLDRACLSTRRPSGVPWVRRRLNSDDNVVLKNATCRWTSNEVSADDSTVIA